MAKVTRDKNRGLSRRQFLTRASVGAAALPLLPGCGGGRPMGADSPGGDNAGGDPADGVSVFQHGIASGDPLSDRVIFWTRVTSEQAQVPVTLRVYRDPELTDLVVSASQTASAARDFTIKLDVAGLQPATSYYYRFAAAGFESPIGRTRTAPVGPVDQLRFGVVSCASAAHGYFNAYRQILNHPELDVILHLGDYIYEYGSGEYGSVRPYEPEHEIISLEDYRTRHAFYKRDPDLMELHRQFPFITVWDDHETADNSWRDGAVNHTEGEEGVWVQRKAWGQQAYDEWMPIRYPQAGNVNKIWRTFSYGDLAEIFMLDTRLYDRDIPGEIPADPALSAEPDRRMMGPEQMNWLLNGLSSSSAQWKIIGQQMVFHQWQVGEPSTTGAGAYLNGDAWDGYQAERQQIIDHIRDNGINNIVFLSGDVHSSWCADITDEPSNPIVYDPVTGFGSVAVEFTATSITSPSAIPIPQGVQGEQSFIASNPHIRYLDLDEHGYVLLNLDAAGVQGEYWYCSTISEPGGDESFMIAYASGDGDNHLDLVPIATPSEPAGEAPPLAP